jgi:DNA polymerase/3'-5' exonuclease PolX
MMIDLYLADETTYETLVLIRTGSKDHNIRLTTLSKGKGWKLKASGAGLVRTNGKEGKDEEILEVIDRTEDGILQKLLGRVPKPEERNRDNGRRLAPIFQLLSALNRQHKRDHPGTPTKIPASLQNHTP